MKKVNIFFKICSIVCSMLLFTACPEPPEPEPSLQANIESYSFSSEGGSKDIAISCNVDWSVSSTESWIEVEKLESGSFVGIRVSVPSYNYQNKREGKVVVMTRTGSKKVTITIRQKGINQGDEDDEYDEDDNDNEDDGSNSGNSGNSGNQSDDTGEIASRYAAGSGTEKDPYVIKTAAELRKLAYDVNVTHTSHEGKYFCLDADICLNSESLMSNVAANEKKLNKWTPIGSQESIYDVFFSGTLDGKGHIISGLYVPSGHFGGLFSTLTKANIKNIRITNAYVESKKVGIIAARIYSLKGAVNISNCYVSGYLKGNEVGGICGYTYIHLQRCNNINIIGCKSDVTIEGDICTDDTTNYLGGIAGYMYNSDDYEKTHTNIYNCISEARISKGKYCGGICSMIEGANIINCKTNSILSGSLYVGGLGGYVDGTVRHTLISNCVITGTVSEEPNDRIYLGALAGFIIRNNTTTCKNCYWNATEIIHGISWNVSEKTPISNCKGMSEVDMKSSDFLSELNKNASALTITAAPWIKGKDGFPTIDINF